MERSGGLARTGNADDCCRRDAIGGRKVSAGHGELNSIAGRRTRLDYERQATLGANPPTGAADDAVPQSAERLEAPPAAPLGRCAVLAWVGLDLQFAREVVGDSGRKAVDLVTTEGAHRDKFQLAERLRFGKHALLRTSAVRKLDHPLRRAAFVRDDDLVIVLGGSGLEDALSFGQCDALAFSFSSGVVLPLIFLPRFLRLSASAEDIAQGVMQPGGKHLPACPGLAPGRFFRDFAGGFS